MLAILCSLVFAGVTALAVCTIIASFHQHGTQALAIVRMARNVPDTRDVTVRIMSPTLGRVRWARLRRQPRRVALARPLIRPAPAALPAQAIPLAVTHPADGTRAAA